MWACAAFSLVFQPDSPSTAQQSLASEHSLHSAESTFKCFDIRGSVVIAVHLAPTESTDSKAAAAAATLTARRTADGAISAGSAPPVSVSIFARACRSLLVCDLPELSFDHCAIAQSHAVSRECTVWNRSEIATRFSFRFASMHPHMRAFDVLDCESGIVFVGFLCFSHAMFCPL
jgi:hypothetical protein